MTKTPQPAPTDRENIGHYPGPWYVKERSVGHGIDVRAQSSRTLIAQVSVGLMANKANARLIAAAPDLLAALKALLADVHGVSEIDTRPLAEAAIALAEGRTA